MVASGAEVADVRFVVVATIVATVPVAGATAVAAGRSIPPVPGAFAVSVDWTPALADGVVAAESVKLDGAGVVPDEVAEGAPDTIWPAPDVTSPGDPGTDITGEAVVVRCVAGVELAAGVVATVLTADPTVLPAPELAVPEEEDAEPQESQPRQLERNELSDQRR